MTRKKQRDGRASRVVILASLIEKPRTSIDRGRFLCAAVDADGGSGERKMKRKQAFSSPMKEVWGGTNLERREGDGGGSL